MKNWLRGKAKRENAGNGPLSVDELVSLGRTEDARMALEDRLRGNSRDRRSQVKLAEVLLVMRRPTEALEMYESAAQGYAGDGFHDKARAVLHKMLKVAPNHDKALLGLEQLDRAKERERRRLIVIRQLAGSTEGTARSMDALRLSQLWKKLSRSAVLEALDTRTLGRLFEYLELRLVEEGVELVKRGDSLEELYLVAGGRVEAIEKRADGPPVILRAYKPGDVFGEGALLEHRPWSAAHRTSERSRLLCLTPKALAAALSGMPDPRAFLDALRVQRHDASLAAMVRTGEAT